MSRQTELNYYRQLKQVAQLVREDVDANIVPLVKQLAPEYTADGWSDTITSAINQLLTRWTSAFILRQASNIASQFVQTAAKDYARTSKGFGIDLYGGDTEMQDWLQASIDYNVALIKDLPTKYLFQVNSAIMEGMTAGVRPSYIAEQLVKIHGMTERRAKLIARDQFGKIQGSLNRIRQKNSGIEYFKWVTSQDERVRHSHAILGSKVTKYGEGVYRWSDLPVNEKGEPTYPGHDINCRCVARPVTDAQVERNIKSGKTDPSVNR